MSNNQHISDKHCEHAMKLWKEFKVKKMGDYHEFFLKAEVMLLADVFEEFKSMCLKYELGPCHCFMSPQLSWDAMLKRAGLKLDFMTDITIVWSHIHPPAIAFLIFDPTPEL